MARRYWKIDSWKYLTVLASVVIFTHCVLAHDKETTCENGVCPIKQSCEDRIETCSTHAQRGCLQNPGWLILYCAKSCGLCELQDPTVRCTRGMLNMSTAPAYRPGTFEVMFTNALEEFNGVYKMEVLSRDPWMLSFEDFLTDHEVYSLLRAVEGGWSQSTEPGSVNAFGEASRVRTKSRTSSTSWCTSSCLQDAAVKKIMSKIENIIRIPRNHFENFQVLKYEYSQMYHTHHDMGPNQVPLPSGPRILTFFLYLSDVDAGGETSFPHLRTAIKPKRGKAVMWVNVKDSDMNVQDYRTAHSALPVISGTKYAANIWVHLYDFSIPHIWRCTGSA